jgi:hypothetical protein
LWRLLGAAAIAAVFGLGAWLLGGGLGRALRGGRAIPVVLSPGAQHRAAAGAAKAALGYTRAEAGHALGTGHALAGTGHAAPAWLAGAVAVAAALLALAGLCGILRLRARRRRRYVRLRVEAYRGDSAEAEAVVAMFEALHKRLLCRWWRRLLWGQPSVALEVHHDGPARAARTGDGGPARAAACASEGVRAGAGGRAGADASAEADGRAVAEAGGRAIPSVWLAVVCPAGTREMVQAALRGAYPNCRLTEPRAAIGGVPAVVRLKKHAVFIKRVKLLDRFEHAREPAMNRLMTTLGACGQAAFVQIALTPTPALFEGHAKRLYKRREAELSRARRDGLVVLDRSLVEDSELRGGLDVQHRPLFFADVRVVAGDRAACERIASELRATGAENHLVERGTAVRHGVLGLYGRRVARGEGNPLPAPRKGVFASTELAALWHLPSVDYLTVPFARGAVALAPAPPGIMRPAHGPGTLRDALGPVSIHPQLRRQNTAVPGTVEQGKSSYLVATVAEDLRRERCAVIVLDPKGDAADAAVSLVPPARTCTLLDFADPTCGFDPLAVAAPADVIADYVVGALKNLFTDADIRASSDRYLRNAIIAVLAYDRRSTLWDAARLLSVGEEGYSYRARVGASVRAMPEFKEISEFFTAELTAQLADARSTTTAKLDAPVNKLARLLNSPSIKRVLLNDSLRVDFDRLIAQREVLVVKGALGAMGAGNTSVLMQLLVGMLDAALARQQDLLAPEQRVAVALKVDEAPLVINRGFAETLALKRSAGLETVACWQTDAQWTEREVREQLDALFAHRVYFATASVRDARAAAELTMAEYSDMVRPGIEHLSPLGTPDARLRLPRHHAIVSWTTPEGRQPSFLAETIPLRVEQARVELHAARQRERGGRRRTDLTQPHWERRQRDTTRHSGIAGGGGEGGGEEGEEGRAAQSETAAGGAAHQASAATPPRMSVKPSPGTPAEASVSGTPAEASVSGIPVESSAPEVTVMTSATASVGTSPRVPIGASQGIPAEASPKMPDTALPQTPAESYRELVELDAAQSVRWAKPPAVRRALSPEALDLEILALIATLRHVSTSQLHRRFNGGRAVTTTQRRLKRLADAGLLDRFQFHRRDGGGVPMCCVIARGGLELLHASGRLATLDAGEIEALTGARPGKGADGLAMYAARAGADRSAPNAARAGTDRLAVNAARAGAGATDGARRLRQARHDVHVSGWALALERAVAGRLLNVRGPGESVLSPPSRAAADGRRVTFGPGDLRLPGGRAAHEFLITDATGARVEVERFETVRPDATIEVPWPGGETAGARVAHGTERRSARDGDAVRRPPAAIDVLVELDDRLPEGAGAAKVERYDHLLAGWSICTRRYGARASARPVVVFVCRDRARARECARRADRVLTACRAYAGEYPADWEYPGREGIVFAAERDAHEGLVLAYGVPPLPPAVRVAAAGGDPRAREPQVRATNIVPGPGGE